MRTSALSAQRLAFGVANRLVRAAAHTPLGTRIEGRPVLVVGTARSGTSWAGMTLSEGTDAAYLREPLTWALLRDPGLGPLTVEHLEAGTTLATIADRAFAGHLAGFDRSVAVRPTDWVGPRPRRLVVKEVLPLALSSLVVRYDPHVVAVVRHPAAVVASFLGRGWRRLGPRNVSPALQPVRHMTEPVEQLGGYAGVLERRLVEQLDQLGRTEALVRYEDMCRRPIEEFRAQYQRLGLTWTAGVEAAVHARSTGQRPGPSFDATNKVSVQRIDAWRTTLTPDQRHLLERGYRAVGGELYGAEF